MCYVPICKVEDIECPDYEENFKVYESLDGSITVEDAKRKIGVVIDLFVRNVIVTELLKRIDNLPRTALKTGERISLPWDRKVALCPIAMEHHLDPGVFHPDIINTFTDVRLKNTIVVLELKDFSCIAKLSCYDKPIGEMSRSVLREVVAKVSANLDYAQIAIYNTSDDWYS